MNSDLSITVPKITKVTDASSIPAAFDATDIIWHQINHCNWPEQYPYTPDAKFRIAHCSDGIMLQFDVSENAIRATEDDNGRIWEDSCVEMFIIPDITAQVYYNLECNCAGRLLLGAGCDRHDRLRADTATRSLIKRYADLGDTLFGECTGKHYWQISLYIPVEALFTSHISMIDGLHGLANFYKCGDKLPQPHFLSYAPVKTDKPDFHRPEYFIPILFE